MTWTRGITVDMEKGGMDWGINLEKDAMDFLMTWMWGLRERGLHDLVNEW